MRSNFTSGDFAYVRDRKHCDNQLKLIKTYNEYRNMTETFQLRSRSVK